ncbi:MAG: hypothetical protein IPP17_13440 [Bacteroidetes bacterium]|nr:hypothetical protein [Bacteroidota bacterium]
MNDFCFSGGYIYTGGEYGIFKGANVSGNWENLGLGHANLVKCLASNGNDLIAGTGFGFYLSADNGTTWHRSTSGIPISSLVPQAVIEDVIVDNGNIYGCSWGDGIYKSTDGGISWIQANAGLPINVILGIDTVVYLSSLSSLNSILYAGTGDDGVYKSLSSGASWIAANNGLPTPCGVINLAVSNPVVYATIWGEAFI